MNFIRGRVHGAEFVAEGFSLNIGAEEPLKNYDGSEVTLGVRPESLSIGEGPIRGEIDLIEHLGPETLVFLETSGTDGRLVAKAPPDFKGEAGDSISLAPDMARLHFFHEGKRIN
jgi:ABC-type sugar transport system ATPase subunit